MIIPYEVDVPFDRHPFLNWLIIAVIILVFVLQMSSEAENYEDLLLDGYNVRGFFAHMWLHGNIFHIAGNLFFLWLFGNAVCSKIGNIIYLPVYLSVGLFAAFSFNLFSDGQALGANGAINGIVGMEDDERSLLRLFGMKEKVAVRVEAEESVVSRGPDDAAVERVLRQRQQADAADRALLDQMVSGGDGYIRFTCSCSKRIKVPNSNAGKIGKCPGCSRRITVPAASIE